MRTLRRLRAKAALICGTALVGAALAACSHIPVVGTVVGHEYDDADNWLMPQTSCVPVGQTTSCHTVLIPMYDPERYLLIVEDAEGEDHKVSVDPMTYERVQTGDHYEEAAK